MAWYRTGTVTVTNGSATITGSGTAFIANASIGEGLLGPDGRMYEITNISSDTSLTISPNYQGSTAGGQGYAIAPLRGRIADLIAESTSLLASFANVRDGVGAGLFPDGSAAAPAGRFASDQDTGFYRVGANTFGIATGGISRVRCEANGSVNIGGVNSNALFNVIGALNSPIQYWGGAGTNFQMLMRSYDGAVGNGLAYRICLDFALGQGDNSYIDFFRGSGGQDGYLGFGTSGVDRLFIQNDGNVRPAADNAKTLGTSAYRWSTVYAGTGTINTSDERDKTWRGTLSADELRAAKRIIAELGIYQWNDAVAEKGEDDARLHFGIRAQQAFAIMKDEGLDWTRYAWCCFDEWEGGERYGVRPDQLAFWLIAAQAAMQADLETRLATLEAA